MQRSCRRFFHHGLAEGEKLGNSKSKWGLIAFPILHRKPYPFTYLSSDFLKVLLAKTFIFPLGFFVSVIFQTCQKRGKLILWTLAAIKFDSQSLISWFWWPLGLSSCGVFVKIVTPESFGLWVSSIYLLVRGFLSFFGAPFFGSIWSEEGFYFGFMWVCNATCSCALSPNYPILLAARVLGRKYLEAWHLPWLLANYRNVSSLTPVEEGQWG